MTRYIDVNDLSQLVARKGLTTCLEEMAEYIRQDYLRWHDFEKCARLANHSPDGVIELMPASDANLYAFKYVNGHPKNTQRGMLTVMAFGALGDVDTGAPLLLSEMTLTTAIRTAATSALAARYLARPDSRSMALIGNGSQSEFQAIAFHALVGIEEIRLYDLDPQATAKLAANLRAFPAIKVVLASSVADAVRGADIVTTVTADKAYATILTADMIEPGMHLNAVGGDCPGKTELHRDIVDAARVIVEYEPQSRIEGEIQQMPADSPITEFWQVVNGQVLGRENDTQVTLFDSVGFAIEDYSALRYVLDVAKALDIGHEIDLVPALENPKDLFARLLPKVQAVHKKRA
ncbi:MULTISPECIES: ornithine cyclodeaminase [Pseudomonas]|jgi:ornithine cyclodeaminase|uniref:ornithine cyclodeaminase n=1 Tax=Pseudomonas TaxID=286 RepID=UPI0005C12C22|nr:MULTISPECIES: ornithine cyclodeaminase [Pseudomonas]KIU42682.1 ornithine cyclodeaminase [Pseudomonas putida]KTC22723.1 ornithine cyclodeaminase [Pseudomonas putida]MCO7503244.1 ornithine cyclodeaminase [Pseudomonas sp. VE 267-6A]MCO7531123.1 ornithine cyclodeaminase [Pseudomonas sp. 2]MCP8349258.1 ornithine cyclodeaminase [Pseudomonas sp. FBF18]